jgi:hypothetical protein
MCAIRHGHTGTAAVLVRLGADINAKDKVRVCEGLSWSWLTAGAARAADWLDCAHVRC